MLRSGEVARELGVCVKTLVRAERRGWVCPGRDWRGARVYTPADLAALRQRLYPEEPGSAGAHGTDAPAGMADACEPLGGFHAPREHPA
jgi:hypothetical protein